MNSHPEEKQKLGTKRQRSNQDEVEDEDEPKSRSLQNDSSEPLSSQSNNLESLPDTILISVANLCAARDFVILSRASKRLRKLLMKRKIVSDFISIGNQRIRKNRSSERLSSSSSERIVVGTLEQLAFYEIVKEQKLLDHNRCIHIEEHDDFYDDEADEADTAVLRSVRMILWKYPSASVVLEAHCGLVCPDNLDILGNAVHIGDLFLKDPNTNITDHTSTLYDRIHMRAWVKKVTEKVAESQDPLREMVARDSCIGWVEIFLRMKGAGFELELPPRPNFYVGMPFPEDKTLNDYGWRG
jgi:hypothetical protein